MKKLQKGLCLLFVAACLFCQLPAVYGVQAGVSMEAMEQTEKENANYQEAFTDAAGNTYSGAVCFDVTLGSHARYDLSGKFSRFTGTLTTSAQTNDDAVFDFAIAVDGKIVFSKQGFTKASAPEKIDVNLSGAQTMQVLTDTKATAFTFLYVADGLFHPAETSAAPAMPKLRTLKDAALGDSGNYRYQVLTQDPLGMLRGNNYLLGKRGDAYATFNLNGDYDTFTAAIFAHTDFGGQIFRSCTVYCDGVQVAHYEDISAQTDPIDVKIDVRNVSVLKIESKARTTSAWNNEGFLVVGDAYLQTHIHEPGAILEDIAPTCALPGKKSYTCTKCAKACAEEELPTLPHTPGQWQTTKAPTCTAVGEQVKHCQECGAVTQTEEVPVTEHVMSSWADVAGSVWDAPIYRERICATCQKTDREEVYAFAWVKPLVLGIVLIFAAAVLVCCVAANKLCAALVKEQSIGAVLRKARTLRQEDMEAAASNLQSICRDDRTP